jgi:hypothetical protein
MAITRYEIKALKLNTDLRGKKAGSIVRIKTDTNGVPLDHYWRNRLKDSKIDNCVELLPSKKKPVSKKKMDAKLKKGGK